MKKRALSLLSLLVLLSFGFCIANEYLHDGVQFSNSPSIVPFTAECDIVSQSSIKSVQSIRGEPLAPKQSSSASSWWGEDFEIYGRLEPSLLLDQLRDDHGFVVSVHDEVENLWSDPVQPVALNDIGRNQEQLADQELLQIKVQMINLVSRYPSTEAANQANRCLNKFGARMIDGTEKTDELTQYNTFRLLRN